MCWDSPPFLASTLPAKRGAIDLLADLPHVVLRWCDRVRLQRGSCFCYSPCAVLNLCAIHYAEMSQKTHKSNVNKSRYI